MPQSLWVFVYCQLSSRFLQCLCVGHLPAPLLRLGIWNSTLGTLAPEGFVHVLVKPSFFGDLGGPLSN